MTDINPRAKIGDNKPPSIDKILADRHDKLIKRKKAWLKKAETVDLKPVTLEDCAKLNEVFLEGDKIMKDAEAERVKEKEPYLAGALAVDGFFNKDIRDSLKGLATKIKQAAADRQLAITEEEQRKLNAEAERLRKIAEDNEAKIQQAEARGDVKQADVYAGRADAAAANAEVAAAGANQDIRSASRVAIGGISSSVGKKFVCTAVNRKELDLESLRPFLKEAALIEAVNAMIKTGEQELKGAVIVGQAVSNVRGR